MMPFCLQCPIVFIETLQAEPKDRWLVDRVVEDMKANEAGVKILVFCLCGRSHSKPDIEFRLQNAHHSTTNAVRRENATRGCSGARR
jgi:hypothetical protein